MESSAEGPCFHEHPVLPESVAHVGLGDPFDTQGELELCGRLNLSMHASKVVSDTNHPIGGRPHAEG
jgi:hypothetical protein